MRYLMAANWKMYKNQGEAEALLKDLAVRIAGCPEDREVLVCAPFTALAACAEALGAHSRIRLGGQNCYPAAEGAFTGEISPAMLRDAGCSSVLTGHSERRALMGESDDFIGAKTAFAMRAGLSVILCIGETLVQRDAGGLTAVLERQLQAGVCDVPADFAAATLSIAYEPVWAIGTGRVAGAPEIVEAHAVIRKFLEKKFPLQGREIRILYGGSVKPENAREIITLDNVNGVLVGGASLQAESFSRIVLA